LGQATRSREHGRARPVTAAPSLSPNSPLARAVLRAERLKEYRRGPLERGLGAPLKATAVGRRRERAEDLAPAARAVTHPDAPRPTARRRRHHRDGPATGNEDIGRLSITQAYVPPATTMSERLNGASIHREKAMA
jgi:hypothetical protein